MLDTLREENPFVGDSTDKEQVGGFEAFLQKLESLKKGEIYPFTMIFVDPMSNCFIQNPHYPSPDTHVIVEEYERTFEENEELGINDMKVN